MSNISDYIVFVWLLPVLAQIVLPLGILAAWLIMKPFALIFRKEATTVSNISLAKETAR
ncbi:hypothetical protein [Desulfopila aestuarii]|uniref:Uncharacterized protein n=1 Tax=Desulfopila aestuarii DSM 18488 TaxID=1121416 RepID=A0A1M7Y714_9BACT|nr:hypothetical protein [Desulfopila aestuarii]SHO48308.1 hypothetical protein SAMN02745220_02252 [Desulfopila aestuarii DSM 18488]